MSPAQERGAAALAAGSTREEAAEAAGVSRRTFFRWLALAAGGDAELAELAAAADQPMELRKRRRAAGRRRWAR